MKIGWISHFFPYPPAGGALQRSYHLLRETASRHEVDLVALRKDRDRPSPDAVESDYAPPSAFCRSVEVFPIPAEVAPLGRQRVLLSGFWDSDPYDDRWLASPELEAHLASAAPSAAWDLMHLDTIGLAQYGECVPAVPRIMNHHNVESHMMARRAEQADGLFEGWYMRREAEKLARWEREWCGAYRENLVVSELDGRRLEDTVPGVSWRVVPNGVDTDYFRPGEPEDRGREGLIFVGRMSWYPNRDAVEWLLEDIWPALAADDPTRSLTLVGSSPPPDVERYPESEIRATGFVPDVRPYMNRAAIYVCPIRTGGGTRLKIVDAMAMGMPLVATGMSVEGLDLEEGRHYLRAESPREFVEAVAKLEEDDRLRGTLAAEARAEAVERFSWSRIGHTLEAVYREAARG